MRAVSAIINTAETAAGDGVGHGLELQLIEREVPVWLLRRTGAVDALAWWRPRSDSVVEDGLLLLAAIGLDDRRVADALDTAATGEWRGELVDVASVLPTMTDDLARLLRRRLRCVPLEVTVLRSSLLMGQLGQIQEWAQAVEIGLPEWWSAWAARKRTPRPQPKAEHPLFSVTVDLRDGRDQGQEGSAAWAAARRATGMR